MKLTQLYSRLKSLNEILPVLMLFASLLLIGAAWLFNDIYPLHALKRIEAEQKAFDHTERQHQFQQKVVENHLALGYAFLDDRLYKKAGIEFDKALAIDKLSEDAQVGNFIVQVADQIRNDFRPQAIERRLKFLQQQRPDNPYVHVLYADLAVQLGDYKAAEAHYRDAIGSVQQPASAYFGLGYLFERQQELDDALQNYEAAVQRSEWNQTYLNNLAAVYRKKGRYQDSVRHYKKILTLDGEYMLPYLEISLSYGLLGNLEKAAKYQARLINLFEQPYVTNQEKNKTPWFFHKVLFETADEKRQYAFYSLSLSLFLLGKEKKARTSLAKAQQIKSDIEKKIKALVAQDLAQLLKQHKQYQSQGKSFKKQFLF